jgi:uncharacterized membrane protein
MSHPPPIPDPDTSWRRSRRFEAVALIAILGVATTLRAWHLGQLSFWYDEVVTMRLAKAESPAALLERLFQIDATRAPLHPLLLQACLRIFGTTETSARSLSVICGVATVVLTWWIGRLAFDPRSGLWGAWLASISPPLVYYSREARMYAWLVMVTCLCWGLLFALRRQAPRSSRSLITLTYLLGLTALLYSHPLGMIMAGTLGLAALILVRSSFGTYLRWFAVHLGSLVLAGPWLPHYFDHPPEFLSGRLPIKFLLGTPIGFLGGNSVVLLAMIVLIGFGISRRRESFRARADWAGPACLMLWLTLPPALLYAYSQFGSPIFGPSRYTLFVAPAYLILVSQGLAKLPSFTRYGAALALAVLAALSLHSTVYVPGLKADWRAFAADLTTRMDKDPAAEVTVIVKSADTGRNVEVETARYYLPSRCKIIDQADVESRGSGSLPPGEYYLAVGSRSGFDTFPLTGGGFLVVGRDGPYPGLAVCRVQGPVRGPHSRPRR